MSDSFKIPLDSKSMIGKEFSIGAIRNNREYEHIGSLILKEDGLVTNFDVDSYLFENGILKLMKDKTVFMSFNGLEIKDGVVYITGHSSSYKSNCKLTLSEPKNIGRGDVCILICSNFTYYQKTFDKIMSSISNAGINKDDVVAVVNDVPNLEYFEESETFNIAIASMDSGSEMLHVNMARDFISDYEYTFVIQDTCAFDDNFVSMIEKIDVGFPSTCHLCHKDSSIGLYKTERLLAQSEKSKESIKGWFNDEIHTILGGGFSHSREKGRVYGSATRRADYYPSTAIIKYKRTSLKREA